MIFIFLLYLIFLFFYNIIQFFLCILSCIFNEFECIFSIFYVHIFPILPPITSLPYLLSKVSPIISKKDIHWRLAIPAKLRLVITLRYLATGDSLKSLQFLFNVSSEIISKIVPEVCTALVEVLKDQVKVKKQIVCL